MEALQTIDCGASLAEEVVVDLRSLRPPCTPHPGRTAIAVPTLSILLRLPPPRCRRGFTLLELLVVLVLLGLGAALVLPSLRLPARAPGEDAPLERARATAIRRGEAVRLSVNPTGDWTVRATADTGGAILLSGTAAASPAVSEVQSTVITALGTCLPERAQSTGTGAWDPARCAVTRH